MTDTERYSMMNVRPMRVGMRFGSWHCAAGPHATDECRIAHRSYETATRCPVGRRAARAVARREMIGGGR